MKVMLLTIVGAVGVVGFFLYQCGHMKVASDKYKWKQERVDFKAAPPGMTDEQIMKHNQEVLRQKSKN